MYMRYVSPSALGCTSNANCAVCCAVLWKTERQLTSLPKWSHLVDVCCHERAAQRGWWWCKGQAMVATTDPTYS